ncbi:hypothetical protein J7E91_34670 [Streptomyces sp. ISL-99]|uniref:DUF6126 family protein n=1 Tax=Streptomyces sp. ISL-99 TaxID=2819193 RepID=UPI001BE8048C|nr:DUF6126 family protein [Streptomyces sp. ISL-99]MBT2530355.1 hypothetical protein [Streptomyces sp. ISL-99]
MPLPGGKTAARRFVEDKIPRGLAIRVFMYVVAGHLFAAFVYLLFTLGGQR